MKVSCDASVRDNGFVGIGFIVHNNVGDVLGAVLIACKVMCP